MSVTYTADVFCDECHDWTNGVTDSVPPLKSAARKTAAAKAKWVHHKGKDYCPECWTRLRLPTAQEAEGHNATS